ncbi:hypothetical protein N0V88_001891 [Collariella sp. IMI 366227]|nr:hypothetical protein N0V88_001891 [Collariella sp. IMI 366227]
MDPLFHVCASGHTHLKIWWKAYQDSSPSRICGWFVKPRQLTTLLPYIGLNLITLFPSTYDPLSGLSQSTDYRQSRLYHFLLHHSTLTTTPSDVAAHPHRQFFGIADTQFHDGPFHIRHTMWDR